MSRTEQATRVLCVGESLVLLREDSGGPLRSGQQLSVGIGGAESNVAIGLRRLGVPSRWIGRVGDDPWGGVIVSTLMGEHVDTRPIIDTRRPTALMLKQQTAFGTRVTYRRAGSAGAALTPSDVTDDDLADVDLLHVTGITAAVAVSGAEVLLDLMRRARGLGVRVSFDVNHRPSLWEEPLARRSLARLAPEADLLFAGVDELALVADAVGSPHLQAREVCGLGVEEVVIKRGEDGATTVTADRIVEQTAAQVSVIDTVGAGDAFVAGYLSALADGLSIEDRLVRGTQCGAAACCHVGDWEAAPTLADLDLLEGRDPVVR